MLREKKENDEMKKKTDKEEKENYEELQQWQIASCQILEKYIMSATTYKLLLNVPNNQKML